MTAVDTRPTFARASGKRRLKNSLASVFAYACFLIALVPLVWVLWTVIGNGLSSVLHASWWTESQANQQNTTPGGGALHAIIGTLEQVALCTVISVPVGLLVAVYLVEYSANGKLARAATFMVDIMTGIPSIVAALFIYALMVQTLGQNQLYGFLVSLALVILMLPVIVRSSEEILRLVPDELREASYALGVPKWKTIMKVVVPTAFTGLITGVILGIARVAGETAPLLILVGYADGTNTNPFTGFQGALPTMIRKEFLNFNQAAAGQVQYHLDKNGNRVAGAVANYAPDRLWGAALTLIILVLALNLIARFIGRFNKVAK